MCQSIANPAILMIDDNERMLRAFDPALSGAGCLSTAAMCLSPPSTTAARAREKAQAAVSPGRNDKTSAARSKKPHLRN